MFMASVLEKPPERSHRTRALRGIKMDRLAAIEAFARIVDARSFFGAARQVCVCQLAVSKTIAQRDDAGGVARCQLAPWLVKQTSRFIDANLSANGRPRSTQDGYGAIYLPLYYRGA
jgi:hypothetical protein